MRGVSSSVGAALGVVAVLWSLQMASTIRYTLGSGPLVRSSLGQGVTVLVGAVVGGITGWMLHQFNMGTERGLLVVVSFLLLVQGPLDLLTSRLSRPLTSGGFITMVVIVLVDAVVMVTLRNALVAALLCALVMAAFGVLHRVSTKSLGFGDVLLVGPLSLAIGCVSPSNIPLWLLAASVSGALHGVMSRVIRKSTTIPFGPHLLGAAWITLVLSV